MVVPARDRRRPERLPGLDDGPSKFDGKELPWEGNPDADTASVTRIDDNSQENTWKKGGAVTIIAKLVVSPDGKTLTLNRSGKEAKGRAVDNTMGYSRQ